MTRVQTDSNVEPIQVHNRIPEAPNLSNGWQRPSAGDNDMQQLASALSAISPALTQYATRQERQEQQEQLQKAQLEFARAKMDGTMEPLRKAVREGKLPEGDNPWLNVFRKKLVAANELNETYRNALMQGVPTLTDPDSTVEQKQQVYDQAKASIQPIFDSTDPIIQGELAQRIGDINNEFETVVAKNRSAAMVEQAKLQAASAISGYIDQATEGSVVNKQLFHEQVGGLLKQAKAMGVMDVNGMLVDSAVAKAREMAHTNPDAALSLLEAVRDYSPVPGASIGQIASFSNQLDTIENSIERDANQQVDRTLKQYKTGLFSAIDDAILAHQNDNAALERIANEFESKAKEDGFNSLIFDIRDHIRSRAKQSSQTMEYTDNVAISNVQRLAYTGEIEEAQVLLNSAQNIPFDTRIQLSKLILSQQQLMNGNKLDDYQQLIQNEMFAPGNVDASLFPSVDANGKAAKTEDEIARKEDEIMQGVGKLRTKLITQTAAQSNMSIAQVASDSSIMADINAQTTNYIESSVKEYAAKLNRKNQQQKEFQQRRAEINNAEAPWRLTEYFRATDTNLRNLDAVRLRMLSKPSTAYTEEAKQAKLRWADALSQANGELDRLAGSMMNGMKNDTGDALTNDEMTQRINEASLKTYKRLHNAIGWSLDEINNGYSRHGLTFEPTDINPLVTRIVANEQEFKQLKSDSKLTALAQKFNVPPEVLLAAQADLLGIEKI